MTSAPESDLFAVHQRWHKAGLGTMPVWNKSPYDATCNQPLKDWPSRRFYDAPHWLAPITGIGLLLGPSELGTLCDVDLDCDEASADFARLPRTRAWGRNGAVRHLLYRVDGNPRTQRWTDPHTKRVLFENRGAGTQTVLPWSVNSLGQRVVWMNREPLARIDADDLLEHLRLFAIHLLSKRYRDAMPDVVRERIEQLKSGPVLCTPSVPILSTEAPRVGANARLRRAEAYLATVEPSISGQGGHDSLWVAAVKMVRGFALSEAEAFNILRAEFNPRCQPRWSERELLRKVKDAAARSHQPWGYLLSRGAT